LRGTGGEILVKEMKDLRQKGRGNPPEDRLTHTPRLTTLPRPHRMRAVHRLGCGGA